MKNKLIAALAAGGCLLGFQVSALAQSLAEHPPFAAPAPAYRPAPGARLYDFYGRQAACNGTYVPASDTCYPFDFQGPYH
jgi:hypothetical protein